jgi:hypothetical protein
MTAYRGSGMEEARKSGSIRNGFFIETSSAKKDLNIPSWLLNITAWGGTFTSEGLRIGYGES